MPPPEVQLYVTRPRSTAAAIGPSPRAREAGSTPGMRRWSRGPSGRAGAGCGGRSRPRGAALQPSWASDRAGGTGDARWSTPDGATAVDCLYCRVWRFRKALYGWGAPRVLRDLRYRVELVRRLSRPSCLPAEFRFAPRRFANMREPEDSRMAKQRVTGRRAATAVFREPIVLRSCRMRPPRHLTRVEVPREIRFPHSKFPAAADPQGLRRA